VAVIFVGIVGIASVSEGQKPDREGGRCQCDEVSTGSGSDRVDLGSAGALARIERAAP